MIPPLYVRKPTRFICLRQFLRRKTPLTLIPLPELTPRLGPAHALKTLGALCVLVFSFLLSASAIAQSPPSQPTTAPHWIWSSTGSACDLERSFRLEQRAQAATLRLAADFCHAAISINGRPVLRVEPHSPTVDADVTAVLRSGDNRIEIGCTGIDGPAAIACTLCLTMVDGQRIEIITNDQWRERLPSGAVRGAVSLGAVENRLWGVGRRSGAINPFDNYEQWRHAIGTPATADKGAFWTTPGFEISLVRQAAPDEGSWISMA